MRAAHDARAYQRGFGVEGIRVYALQRIAAHIVVAVAGGACKAGGVHAVFLHRADHLALVVLGDAIDGVKALAQGGKNLLAELVYLFADAQLGIHMDIVHGNYPSFPI